MLAYSVWMYLPCKGDRCMMEHIVGLPRHLTFLQVIAKGKEDNQSERNESAPANVVGARLPCGAPGHCGAGGKARACGSCRLGFPTGRGQTEESCLRHYDAIVGMLNPGNDGGGMYVVVAVIPWGRELFGEST